MRIRTVKPEFFLHERIYDAEKQEKLPMRIAYIGLWCAADREGRFEWRPRSLKAQLMPFDDVDFSRVLDALMTRGFLLRYSVDDREFGQIISFTKHQVINNRERESEIPPPPSAFVNQALTRAPRVDDACPTESQEWKAEGNKEQGTRNKEQGRDNICAESDKPTSPPLLIFPVKAKEGKPREWNLCADDLATLTDAFPGIDCLAEARKALGWVKANAAKQKTATGMPRFLYGWVERSNNNGRAVSAPSAQQKLTGDEW